MAAGMRAITSQMFENFRNGFCCRLCVNQEVKEEEEEEAYKSCVKYLSLWKGHKRSAIKFEI